MKTEIEEPWNDENTPIAKNGARNFFIVTTIIIALVYISLLIYAYYKR